MKSSWLATFGLLFLGCAHKNPYFDSSKPHHTPSGFKNVYANTDKSFFDFMKWRFSQLFKPFHDPETMRFSVSTLGRSDLQSDKDVIAWVGHSTFFVRVGGVTFLTDPQFSERASPVSFAGPKRVIEPGLKIEELPKIDFIVLSHDHYDHMDQASLTNLIKFHNSKVLTPLGYQEWMAEHAIASHDEFDWWQSKSYAKQVSVTAVPVQHWCRRSLWDTNHRLWAGWVLEVSGRRIFFAGDVGMSKHFDEIRDRFDGFDLSIIPIGAYEPRWFMKMAHINPEEAVMVHQIVRSKKSVGAHWGTFKDLTDEPLNEPPLKLKEALKSANLSEQEFFVLQHGETRAF